MSRKDKLIKSKSIYTIRKKHQTVSTGTIYENDHVTIIQHDGIFNSDMPLFSDSNFKFRIRTGDGGRKKHARYGWINNEFSESQVWTLSSMPEKTISEETKIVQKPNYQSLRDFAYYGSAVELVKATINDIIMRYPGGISYYNGNDAPEVWVEGRRYYLISNEFNIDFWTPKGVSPDELENPMRVLGASYMNYEDRQGRDINLTLCITGYCPDSIIGKVSFSNYVPNNGEQQNNGREMKSRNVLLGAGEGDSDGSDSGNGGGTGTGGVSIGGEEQETYVDITITAYTKSQCNNLSPIKNANVMFYAFVEKDCSEYRKIVTTDNNGVATARVGINQNWMCVNGESQINFADYWCASLVYNGITYYVNAESETTIRCTNALVKSISNDQRGTIQCNRVDKQIFVSAYTLNQNNIKLPIRNELVELHAYSTKENCTEFVTTAITDNNGVVSAFIGNGCGWNLVSGNSSIDVSECDFWACCMTYNGESQSGKTATYTISCNGLQGNDLSRNDIFDEIEFDYSPSFRFLRVNVVCDENDLPISNAYVQIEATTISGSVYTYEGYTNEDGYLIANNDISQWRLSSIISSAHETLDNISMWKVFARVNDDTNSMTLYMPTTEATLEFTCRPDYPYDSVTVYTNLRQDILSGANATIVISDGKTTKNYTGITDSNGSFTVYLSDCTGFTGYINSWNCYATYSGVTIYGEQHLIRQDITINNSQTLTFNIKEEEEETYDLIVTALTKNQNGTTAPMVAKRVDFLAYVPKDCTIYYKSAITNSNGVATVTLGENQGWERRSGENGIGSVEFWSASINYGNQTIYGSNARNTLHCANDHYVNSIVYQQYEDVVIYNYTAKKLIVSAYTVTPTGVNRPIIGETVEFHAFVDKSCTEYSASVTTNSVGIASIYLSEGEGWKQIPNTGTDSLESCDFWRACMTHEGEGHSGETMHGTLTCAGVPANSLRDSDYTDLILYNDVQSFEYLKITTLCNDDSNSPIPNVSVWIIASTDNGFSYRINGHTNANGEFIAHNDIDDGWYMLNPYHHTQVELNDIVNWKAYAIFDGQQQESSLFDLSHNEHVFTYTCTPSYALSCLTVYTYSGLPGINAQPIQGANAIIWLCNDKGQCKDFPGITEADGSWTVCLTEENINQVLGHNVHSWWCEAEYNGVSQTGRTIEITEGNYQNYQNLYFSGDTPQTGIKLTASAYTISNGVKTPIPNEVVTFYVTASNVDAPACSKTARTNSNGVAYVYLSDPGWECYDSYVLTEPACWYVTMAYNGYGTQSGITTTSCECWGITLQNTNPIKTKRTDEINFVLNEGKWWFCDDEITIHTVFTDGTNATNIPVSVSAITPFGGTFWIGGRTNEQGQLALHASSGWRRLTAENLGNIYEVSIFSACGVYNNQTVCGVIEKVGGDNCSITLEFEKKLEPAQFGCDDIDNCDYEWFDIYMDGEGNKKLVTDSNEHYDHGNNELVIIRPKKQFRQEFWDSLDDFERVILDRDTTPIYKARFETPYTIDNIYYFNLRNYILPTVDGETPDLTTPRFQGYLRDLINLAEYHDEYDSDNLWRMMTHESIKNLDWTFMRNNDVDNDDSLDSTRMRGMLCTYGRLFDDLKRYADNIKTSNNITYDEKNNVPDYFLTDAVEIGGFEAKSVTSFSALTSGDVYGNSGRTRNSTTPQVFTEEFGKTLAKVNSDFMRRLAINEVYIQLMKGTRRGLQAILGLFGYTENTNGFTTVAGQFDIHEYVAIANEFPLYSEAKTLRSFAENIMDFGETEIMTGYPVAVVSPGIDNPTEEDYYLIPWYSDTANYKYDFYFQEKGGWGRMLTKSINEPITVASSITEDYDIRIYKETEPYIKFVTDIEALKSISNNRVFENMVCYVTDISGMYGEYAENEESGQGGRGSQNENPNGNLISVPINTDYSHYFVLKNVALSNYIGFVDNELYHCYGWKNVHLSEFSGQEPTTEDGLRVLYLESLIENGKDNNPHTGKGKYDDGSSYLERYNLLFGNDFDNGLFDHLSESGDEELLHYYEEAQTMGFSLSGMVENNKKCYYFEDSQTTIESRGLSNDQPNVNVGPNNWAEDVYTLVPVGEEDEYDYSDYDIFVNPEDSESHTDEAAANSVVNVKNLVINFGTNGNKHLKKYIEVVVMPYLEHMIPSTAILKYMFDGVTANVGVGNTTPEIISSQTIVADMVTIDENSTYLFENNENIV